MFFYRSSLFKFFILNKKKYIKSLKFKPHENFYSFYCQMIQWNKYIIFYEFQEKVIKIFDLENEQFISNIGINKKRFNCFKKIYHKVYGEALIISFHESIDLWN